MASPIPPNPAPTMTTLSGSDMSASHRHETRTTFCRVEARLRSGREHFRVRRRTRGDTHQRKARHDTTSPHRAAVTRKTGEPPTDVAVQADSDAEIIRLSAQEPERFAQIFDRHYADIHGYVARRLGSGLADDVAAGTFLIAFDRRDRYDVAYPVARPWLYGIASNLVFRHHRAEIRQYRALS